jgi:hypothetical protein
MEFLIWSFPKLLGLKQSVQNHAAKEAPTILFPLYFNVSTLPARAGEKKLRTARLRENK